MAKAKPLAQAAQSVSVSRAARCRSFAEFQSAVRTNPEHTGARYNLGTALAGLGRLPEAEAEFRRALRLDPQNAAFTTTWAAYWTIEGRMAEAAVEFEGALRINPELTTTRENLERARARFARIK